MSETEQAIEWFESRKAGIALPGARMMNNLALTALRAQLEREKGCEYCNDPDMPTFEADCMNHKDWHYHFCPMCGKKLEGV